jgi:dephospho-CoA kinase
MAQALRIGLTGGIASGKSAVADAFARRGVPIIDADLIAREVVEPDQPAFAAVTAAFGNGILGPDGRLDRRRLRQIVFADPERRRTLEGILHPAIRAEVAARVRAVTAPYVVVAIPLLAESGRRNTVDRVLVVDCPESLQVERLLARDVETPEGAAAILRAQATPAARRAIADDLLTNDGSLAALDAAVGRLHDRYLALAAGAGPDPA